MDDKTTFWAGFIAAFAILILTPLAALSAAIVNAWAVTHLWTWFVTPIFSVAVPRFWLLAGLFLTVRQFTYNYAKDERKWYEHLITTFVAPVFAVLFGGLIHWLAA